MVKFGEKGGLSSRSKLKLSHVAVIVVLVLLGYGWILQRNFLRLKAPEEGMALPTEPSQKKTAVVPIKKEQQQRLPPMPMEEQQQLPRPHPHAGARDETGALGYIHDPTYLRTHPLPLDFEPPGSPHPICQAEPGQGEEGAHGWNGLQKIKIFDPGQFRKTIPHKKIMCIIYTHSERHHRVRAVAETWAPRCDGFLAASNLTDRSIGAAHVLHLGEEAYGNMWQKVRSIWAYVHDEFLEDYEYFHIGGDDMVVIPENLRIAVAGRKNEATPVYMGGAMMNFPRPWETFCGGGSGYTLNRAALTLLVNELYPQAKCWPNATDPAEDVLIGNCFRMAKVTCLNSVDFLDEPRYHCLDANFHASWYKGMPTPIHWSYLQRKRHNIKVKEGLETISKSSISFHLAEVKSSFPDHGLRRYHALLYGLCDKNNT